MVSSFNGPGFRPTGFLYHLLIVLYGGTRQLAKISAKIDTVTVDEIDADRKTKGLKLSEWVALAIDTYLHPQGQDTEITQEISHF